MSKKFAVTACGSGVFIECYYVIMRKIVVLTMVCLEAATNRSREE
jgi:hypothetical protein